MLQPKIYEPLEFVFNLPECTYYKTDNGISVYKLLHPDQEAVQIEWTFEAGLWNEEMPGIAQTVGRLIKNGTELHSEIEINEQLEFLGASLRIAVNNDYTHISLMTLNKHLPTLLPIVKEIITQANFSPDELNIFVKNAIQALRINLQKNDFVGNRLIEEQLFGIHHPYGRYLIESDYLQLSSEALRQYHRHFFHYKNCKIFIAGGLKAQEEELLIQLFGDGPWGHAPYEVIPKSHIVQPADEKNIFHTIDDNNVQSAIRMARHTIHYDNAEYLTLQFLNIIFGGYFGSRLMSNIREDKGYTYGIYSYLASHKHQSYLIITTEVDHQYTQATIDEIRKEMLLLQNQRIDEEELLMAKNYVLGSLLSDMDGVFSLMQMWKSLILHDHNSEHFYNKIEKFKKISAEELQAIAQQYMQPDDFYLTVVH